MHQFYKIVGTGVFFAMLCSGAIGQTSSPPHTCQQDLQEILGFEATDNSAYTLLNGSIATTNVVQNPKTKFSINTIFPNIQLKNNQCKTKCMTTDSNVVPCTWTLNDWKNTLAQSKQ